MKLQKTVPAVMLLLLSNILFAQWNIVSSPEIENNLQDVHFIDENTGWIVGDEGYVLYTDNGGESWTKKEVGTDKDLAKVFFLNENLGWIGTGNNLYETTGGSVLRTTDGGQTWTENNFGYVLPNLDFNYLDGLIFIDENNGYIVAGRYNHNYIMKTEDGGITWALQDSLISVGSQYHRWYDIDFYDQFRGVVVGSQKDRIKFTVDGGQNWQDATPIVDGFFGELQAVTWINETTVIAVGEGREFWSIPTPVYRSTNYGQDWEKLTESPAVSYNRVKAMYVKDEQNLVCVGSNGFDQAFVYTTENSGVNWTPQSPEIAFGFRAVSGIGNTLYAIGSSGHIVKSLDFGATWEISYRKSVSSIESIQFVDGVGFAVTRNGDVYFNSSDGTSAWTYISNAASPTSAVLHFFNQTTGCLLKDNKHISKTTDGGLTWTNTLSYNLYNTRNKAGSMEFVNENIGYALMSIDEYTDYYLFKTENGGDSWTPKKYFDAPSTMAGDMLFFDENNGCILGPDLWGVKTTDGGTTWTELEFNGLPVSLELRDFKDITRTGTSSAWAVGTGLLFKTEDGGSNWVKVDHNLTDIDSSFYAIEFNDNNGYIACYDGTILITEDGGATWTVDDTYTDVYHFYSMAYNSTGNIFMGTSDGHIIAWDVTVGVDESPANILPDGYTLYQNYPNPFNPSTNIVYDLKNAGNVKIVVYDYLGREVSVIENGFKQAGQHAVEFNAAKSGKALSSGIYFYKIHTDSFTEIKKMIYLK